MREKVLLKDCKVAQASSLTCHAIPTVNINYIDVAEGTGE